MKIRFVGNACLRDGYIICKPVDNADDILVNRLFSKKTEREEKLGNMYLDIELDLQEKARTYSQLKTAWKLVECIYVSQNMEKPTEEEKYDMYLDLLEVYADKVENTINGEKRPVRLSDGNTASVARFIEGLMYHLSLYADLDFNAQSDVVRLLKEWEAFRSGLEKDPLDYSDIGCTVLLTEKEWREKKKFSDASGKGGYLELAHIVSKGSDESARDKAWNWLCLTREEHALQHEKGWEEFLRIYPHLKGRVYRARRLTGGKDESYP